MCLATVDGKISQARPAPELSVVASARSPSLPPRSMLWRCWAPVASRHAASCRRKKIRKSTDGARQTTLSQGVHGVDRLTLGVTIMQLWYVDPKRVAPWLVTLANYVPPIVWVRDFPGFECAGQPMLFSSPTHFAATTCRAKAVAGAFPPASNRPACCPHQCRPRPSPSAVKNRPKPSKPSKNAPRHR